jgi:radical SAM protein with 4Fe4S-binding SPASM domain
MASLTQTTTIRADLPYFVPSDIEYIAWGGKTIVIRPHLGNWLVLDRAGLQGLKFLQAGLAVLDATNLLSQSESLDGGDAIATMKAVIGQCEARQFCVDVVREVRQKSLYIILTNQCDLRCRHCYAFAGDVDWPEWSAEDWIDVIDEFAAEGGEAVTITGGEPTISGSFNKVIRKAKARGLSVTVLSNGCGWSSWSDLEFLKYIDELQLSLDGPDRSSHESVRGKGTFEKVLLACRRAIENNVNVSIAMTPIPSTFAAFEDGFVSFATDMLARYPDRLKIKLGMKLLPGRDVDFASDSDADGVYLLQMGRRLLEQVYPDYARHGFYLDNPPNVIRRNCGYGSLSVAPDGRFFYCNRVYEMAEAGNLRTTGLKKAMALGELERDRTAVENVEPCNICSLRMLCAGGCRLDDVRELDGKLVAACPTSRRNRLLDHMLSTADLYLSIVS